MLCLPLFPRAAKCESSCFLLSLVAVMKRLRPDLFVEAFFLPIFKVIIT